MSSQRSVFSLIAALLIFVGASVNPAGAAYAASTGTLSMHWPSVGTAQNSGTRLITVNRSGGSSGAASVRCTTVNGTAVAGTDFTAVDTVVNWASGDSANKSCNVSISNATPFTGTKTFYVQLSNASGAPLGTQTKTTVTIDGDKNSGVVSLSAPTYTVSQSAGSVTVTITRTNGSTGNAVVGYATANGTAVAGVNYTAMKGAIGWGNGDASSKSFTIPISKTTSFSGSKTIAVAIALAQGASLGSTKSAIVTVNGSTATAPPTSPPTAPPSAPTASDPTSGVLAPYDDAYANWKNAGLASVGGIPTRTTVCATVNPLGGGKDDFSNIQNAINNCPTGQVVQLGAGAFSVHLADLPIHVSKGITLRGTGDCGGSSSPYCQTSISVTDGALAYTGGLCGTSTASEVACPNGGPAVILMAPVSPSYNYSWAKCGNIGSRVGTGCGAISLAADAAQGQSTIQLTSTSGLSVGQWVLIDEASGAGWIADPLNQWTGYGSVWAASDWLSSSGSPATGRVMWSKSQNGGGWDFGANYPYQASSVGCWHSYCDRPTAELHKIASVGAGPCPGSACTVTFDDPLTIAFRQSGNHNAQIYGSLYASNTAQGSPISLLQSAGVENLSVLRGVNGGMEMALCANCWIKNTEVGDWYGGGINIEYSARSELNTVYVHHCWNSVNNGAEYPIALDDASTEILITNSITNFGGKGMVARAGGAGSVVSYSYVDDTMYDSKSGIGDYWLDMGLNASHYSGPHHVLFEGNWADNLDNDNTHGNSMYMTFFRNQSTGMRTPFTDPSIGKPVNDFARAGFACGTTGASGCAANPPAPFRAAGPMAYNYWFAFVGNVLGLAGETTAANGWSYQGDWSAHRIFMLGWNAGPGGQDPYMNGVKGSYVFINGNFDYLNNSIAAWASGSPHTLPNSFYLASAPASFSAGTSCTYSWPWVTPTGSAPIQANSCGGSGLPAKARYEAGTPLKQP